MRRRTHHRRMDVRLRPCQQDTNPSHRPPLDRYAVTPPTIWTRETDEETGAIYRNGTMTETTSFIISLDSFRVQSLQEHEIRVIARYGTTVGELTRHISTHYGANPRDLYLTVDGTPLENWDKVNSDYGQHILLRTRLRGGVRRSSTSPRKCVPSEREIPRITPWANRMRTDKYRSGRACPGYATECGHSTTLSCQRWTGSYRRRKEPYLRMISRICTT